jgi:hypothetical protein
VSGVIGSEEDAIEQFSQLLGSWRGIDVEQVVQRFAGRHVVRLRANTADSVGQVGHIFSLTADAKLLEPPQFGDLQIGVGDISFLVQENVNLAVAFESGDWIN